MTPDGTAGGAQDQLGGGARLSEADLDAARGEREGAAWFRANAALPDDPTLEGATIVHRPSATPISGRAFDLIVEFEVSSPATYEARFRGPVWPGGASGVTFGIGYDAGYATAAQLRDDWHGAIPDAMLAALEGVIGITGTPAQAAAAGLRGRVDIPFAAAIAVHRGKVIPRWVGLVEDSLPNTGLLSGDSLGALVSLTYNRGATFSTPGDRFTEMRAIREHMAARQFAQVPLDISAMKRLWPAVPGLQSRREREAQLFKAGLPAPARDG